MSFFKRSKDTSEFELEDFPTTERQFSQPAPAPHTPPAPQASPRATVKQSYGIEDAIALMRKLPNVNSEITITVVKKTLESANIQVEQIISDAERKESQIETRTDQLSKEIDELQDRIARLNQEISELTADLKETNKVKNLLLGVNGQEKSQTKPSAETPKREMAPQATPVQAKESSPAMADKI